MFVPKRSFCYLQYSVGRAAYTAAQVTRSCFQVFSLGAWACASAPGPKPMQGLPLRHIMETPFVEKVHLSVSGRAFLISAVSSVPIRALP